MSEACYLMCTGMEPIEVCSQRKTKIKAIVFPGKARAMAQKFYSGDDMVSARTYSLNFHALRRLVHTEE
jgi:hypothetical protein